MSDLTPGRELQARVEVDHARAIEAGRWVSEHMPNMVSPTAGVCSFAIALALRLRKQRPDLKADELAREIRVQREVWMRRSGAWDEVAA